MPIHDASGEPRPSGRGCDPELAELLDGELARLPDHYRAPILLCDVEGLSRREAAARLGCPEGTVAGHLARGRAMLARRLLRRGIAPSAAAAALGAREASAVPPVLAESAARAGAAVRAGLSVTGVVSIRAAELAQSIGTAGLGRWKMAIAAVALIATVGLGAGVGSPRGTAPQYVEPPRVAEAPLLPLPRDEPNPPADVKPPVDADDAAAAKPDPETEALRRYERARVLLEEAQANNVAREMKNAKLREARELVAENLTPAVRDAEPEVHEMSMYLNGHVMFVQSEFSEAVAALGAAIEQYPRSSEATHAKYLRGRCYYFLAGRESHLVRDEKLSEPEREAAKRRMKELLDKAIKIAEPMEAELLRLDANRELAEGDKEQLSQVSFLVAECHFFSEDFNEAVRRYNVLRSRYPGQIQELISLAQLWWCHSVYLDEARKGDAMLAAMREVLKALPDDQFDGSTAVRTRKHWQDWIKHASGDAPRADIPPLANPPALPPSVPDQLQPSPPGYDPALFPMFGQTVVRASMNQEGRIVCKFPKRTWSEPVRTVRRSTWFAPIQIMSFVQRSTQEERAYLPEQLTVRRADGKPVSAAQLAQRLAKETRVLFVAGCEPDAEMLHLMKGNTLIISPKLP